MAKTKFDNSEILTDREIARTKTAIFFDSVSNFYHPLKEVIANGIDEINNNFDHGEIKVELLDDYTLRVTDSGRGLNILAKNKDGVEGHVVYFEKLFAGTKYGDDINKNSIGTNGVGLTVINYTSTLFRAVSQYDGTVKHVEYHDGGQLFEQGEEGSSTDEHFTEITFRLDPDIYTETKFDKNVIKDIVENYSIPCKKIAFTVVLEGVVSRFETPSFEGYFNNLIGNQSTSKVLYGAEKEYLNKGVENNKIEVLFTTMPNIYQKSYLNNNYLSKKGTIHDGIINAVRVFGNKYCSDNKLFPKGVSRLRKEDVEASISYLIRVESSKVEYTGQTKFKTEKELYKEITNDYVTELLEICKNEDPDTLKKIYKHIMTITKANVVVAKAQKKLKKQLSENVTGINNRVDKLKDCRKHDEDSEIHFAEGDSAGGSLVKARDADYQAIYPLRGKFLNVMKATETEAINNPVLMDIIKIIGTGIQSNNKAYNTFDINNSKYGKIFIDSDSDSDGSHIQALFITFMFKYMRPLIEAGRLYILVTPLYIIHTDDGETIYYNSDLEKDVQYPKLKGKPSISRLKGLGEMDAGTLESIAMNKDTRTAIQVTIEDAEKLSKLITTWMAKDVGDRRDIITDSLSDYIDLI